MSSNTENQSDPEIDFDIVALPTQEVNPVKRPFEQVIKIEWTPMDLINELAQRMKRVSDYKKEQEAYDKMIAVDQRQIDHLNRILELPEVKVLVDAEAEYLKQTAVDKAMEEPQVEVPVEDAPVEDAPVEDAPTEGDVVDESDGPNVEEDKQVEGSPEGEVPATE